MDYFHHFLRTIPGVLTTITTYNYKKDFNDYSDYSDYNDYRDSDLDLDLMQIGSDLVN